MTSQKKVALIVQARMGSTRLPGKVNKTIQNKPMLQHQLERLKKSKKVDALILATTDSPLDDAIVDIANGAGVEYFRGSELDVLDRFYEAARAANATTIIRVTGDCPLHHPDVVDEVVERFATSGADYAKQPENYPEGVDTEVFSFEALESAWKEAVLPSEREHVTLFIRNNPDRFKIDEWTKGDFDHSTMHWSVDTPQDFEFVSKIYDHLHTDDSMFGMNEVLELLAQNPDLLEINKGGTGYEGLAKSLKEDEEFKKRDDTV